ncbi:MAG: AraC family transcriptional regulator [Desulfuromonadales bacterium]|nr:AraC family transcriptional regulator [Desulfuromonadales bacterium]
MATAQVRYFKPEGLTGLELLTCPDVNYLFPPHFHQAYCIWLNTSGGEHYTHRGNSSILQPGDFGIIAPGEVHENYACDNSARSLITFYLDPEQLQSVGAQITGTEAGETEFLTDFYQDTESLQGLIALHHLLNNSHSALERESAFVELLALLIRRHGVTGAEEIKIGTEKDRVARIIEQFHTHLAEDIGLEKLAAHFDCTPYHLIRFFKKAVGLSPHAYLIQLRLEKAKRLLNQGTSIVDAALDTGFTDQSHLTRHFKTKFGIPPGTYRRQLRNT